MNGSLAYVCCDLSKSEIAFGNAPVGHVNSRRVAKNVIVGTGAREMDHTGVQKVAICDNGLVRSRWPCSSDG